MAKKATTPLPAAKPPAATVSRAPAARKASIAKPPPSKAAPKAASKPAAAAKAGAAKPPAKSKGAKTVAKPVMTVTTKQMAAALAEKQDMPKKQADALLADVFGMVIDHLKEGDRVRIAGIGIIEVKDRPARMGRNPATGEPIPIKASRKIAFRAAKELKQAV